MKDRRGFSLLEVLIALVILGFVILGAQATLTGRMVTNVGVQELHSRATQLAMDRLHLIQADPAYGTLAERYTATETSPAGATGFQRVTRFTTTALNGGQEYRTVTVTVTNPRLPRTISRTVVIASP
jgi:prepilin-type N-terminal cleavage/methylation domain-containing protein